jgi:hypothetical protein
MYRNQKMCVYAQNNCAFVACPLMLLGIIAKSIDTDVWALILAIAHLRPLRIEYG